MGTIQLQAITQNRSSLKDYLCLIWFRGKRTCLGLAICGGVYLLCRWFYRRTRKSKTVQILIPIQAEKTEEFRTAISTLLSQDCPIQRFIDENRKWIITGLVIGIGVYFIPVVRKWISQMKRNENKVLSCSNISFLFALWVNGLFKRIVSNNISYECELCDNVGSLLEGFPLIVVCPMCTRPEDSIDTAIHNMPGNIQFAVVLLHSCLERFLPEFPTTRKLPEKDKYGNIKFIDIAINMDAKLYRCKMNEDARIELKSFIESLNNT